MTENNSKIYKGQEASKAEINRKSPGMGEINPPTGLPEQIKSLIITFDTSNGNLQVAGHIEDRVLCYGMLESAKDVIKQFNENKSKKS